MQKKPLKITLSLILTRHLDILIRVIVRYAEINFGLDLLLFSAQKVTRILTI